MTRTERVNACAIAAMIAAAIVNAVFFGTTDLSGKAGWVTAALAGVAGLIQLRMAVAWRKAAERRRDGSR